MQNHDIKIFSLSTCLPCKKTKEFLEQRKVPFEVVYVDTLEGRERETAIEEVRKHNPQLSFPTLVVGEGEKVIVGFRPEALVDVVG